MAGCETEGASGVSVIYVLLVASLLVAGAFLGAFIWAVRSGQFEDTETPGMRVLGDEDPSSRGIRKRKEKET